MRVGDLVIRDRDKSQSWRVLNTKSDSRAFWIQLDEDRDGPDVWHDASYFEVINESR